MLKVYAAGLDTLTPEEVSKLNKALGAFKGEINDLATFLIAFTLVTAILCLIIHFIRLQGSYSHPLIRRDILKDIFTVLICVSLLSAVGLIISLILNSFI